MLILLWSTGDPRANAWGPTASSTSALVPRSRPATQNDQSCHHQHCDHHLIKRGKHHKIVTLISIWERPPLTGFVLLGLLPGFALPAGESKFDKSCQTFQTMMIRWSIVRAIQEHGILQLLWLMIAIASVFFFSPLFGWLGERPRSAILRVG